MKYKKGDDIYLKGQIAGVSSCSEVTFPYEVLTADGFISAREEEIVSVNEPEKPVVPQFVADWIEDNREALEEYVYSDVQIVLPRIQDDNPMHSWLDGKGIGIIVDCVRNGYEVEKEKLYTARLKLVTYKLQGYINKIKESNALIVADSDKSNSLYQVHFTQAELEKLNVWDNPAFEIKEV